MRDHCLLTLRHKDVSPNKCKSNTTEKRSNFILCTSHNFSTFQCHLFPKKFVAKKKDKVKIAFITKTKEEDISVTFGCIRFC